MKSVVESTGAQVKCTQYAETFNVCGAKNTNAEALFPRWSAKDDLLVSLLRVGLVPGVRLARLFAVVHLRVSRIGLAGVGLVDRSFV